VIFQYLTSCVESHNTDQVNFPFAKRSHNAEATEAMKLTSKGNSSSSLFNEIQRRAGQNVAATGPVPMIDGPSIPIRVNLDRETGSNIREDFLWRLKGVFRSLGQDR
jgi:hypothetical protein